MRSSRQLAIVTAAWAALGSVAALGAAKDFDFKDPKGVNAMSFLLDSVTEPINGLATGISGTVSFDPASPKATTGQITVAAKSLNTSNAKMTEVLHSADWLDVAKYPEITFKFKEVRDAKTTKENAFELQVVGDFTCHGVTKELTIPVRATYLPGALSQRLRGQEGDLLVLRAEFVIKRTDFGIKPDQSPTVVADEIQLRANIVGAAGKK